MLECLRCDTTKTDEEKIVIAKQHGFTCQEIKDFLHIGNTKICRVLKQFRETATIPEKLKRGAPIKLTPNVLTQINSMIRENAKVSLTTMSQAISNKEPFNISKTTVSRKVLILCIL